MAKPIKGTNGADNLSGTDAADTIQGGAGNDTIFGSRGNDDIDGGQDIDTVVYGGSYNQYVLTFKGTGNDKVTVQDTVLNRDGIDDVKKVEFLQFNDAIVNLQTGAATQWSYAVNATLDASQQDPASPGNLYVGSGIPATNFGTAHNTAAGIELGLQVLYRQGPTVASTDNYNDGVLHFSVNDGPQSTANGSIADNSGRAAWNFTFSVATGLDGETTDLGDFTFKLLYDVDPGTGTSYRTLTMEPESTPQAAGQSGYQWRDQDTGVVFIADDEGNANVTQNSENYAFAFFQNFLTSAYGPGNAFAGPAHFDIELQAFDGVQLVGRNHIVVDVIL